MNVAKTRRAPGSLGRQVCLVAATVMSLGVLPGVPLTAATNESAPPADAIVQLSADPTEIALTNPFDYAQVVVTGTTADGVQVDVTRDCELSADEAVVKVNDRRMVRPVADGSGELRFSYGSASVSIPVTVSGQNEPYNVSFVRDVQPVLAKLGCNAGTCHGSRGGKNGFKLSLRGYDPVYDHTALTDELAGRRFNRAAPEKSLMLLKPSGMVAHEGGMLIHAGEPYYEMIRSWIAAGVKLDVDAPRVVSIELSPKKPVISRPEMQQQMKVIATYSDGSRRDVTAEAIIDSSLTEVVTADKAGLLTAVRRGEAAALARYQGAYDATPITVMGNREGFVWEAQPVNNQIDTYVDDKLERFKILPSGLSTDAEFLRRVYLDLTGLPPTVEQVRAFLADNRDTRLKRDELIDQLVGSDAYVDHWTNKWADLLQVNRKSLSEKGAWALRAWIRHAIANNMPYDQFAHTILTASGSTFENPPASYLRVLRTPEDAMENSTQLFLGVRFNCNKCHDHPFERWTQDQYYDLSAYFAQVGRKKGLKPDDEIVFDTAGHGEVKNLRTGKVVEPEFPYQHDDLAPKGANRREQFAHWVISPENQYFAKSYVNRLWSYLLGVGLIEPIDDIRAGNPPTNPELLDWLTNQFVKSGFDTQQLITTICKSRTYQLSIQTNQWNADDSTNYSHALARRLPAETLFDAIHQVTGSEISFPGVPVGMRASQLPDPTVQAQGGFLNLFGRPPRESACECERSNNVMLSQALTLVNGPTVADAINDPTNNIARWVAENDDDSAVVEQVFLSVFCRPPTDAERQTGIQAMKEADTRLAGAQDLTWALLNSPAFLFNR